MAFRLRKARSLSHKDHPKHTRLQKKKMMQVKGPKGASKLTILGLHGRMCHCVQRLTLFSIFFPSCPGFSFQQSSLIGNISNHYSLS